MIERKIGFWSRTFLGLATAVVSNTPAHAEVNTQRQGPSISMKTECRVFFDDEGERHQLMTALIESTEIPLDSQLPHRLYWISLLQEGEEELMFVANMKGGGKYDGYFEGHITYYPESPIQEDTEYEVALRIQDPPENPIIVASRHRSAKCPETPNP